jgi:hypothetical protein
MSVEEAIEFAQLMAGLSRESEETIAVLDELAPLLDKEYNKKKTVANSSAALLGCAVVVTVAVFWWNPLGWTAGFVGAGAKWVAAHQTTSAMIATAGTGATAVCGTKAKDNHDQRKLMEDGTYNRM